MTQNGYSTGRASTEWEDALVKHKIIERKAKPPTQDTVDTQNMWDEKEKEQRKYENATLAQLNKLEDDIDEDQLDALRKKRLEEIKLKAEKDKFGYIKQIGKPEYEKEVTIASQNMAVICCLFMYGQESSKIMLDCLEKVASKYKYVKFVKIIGNECIPNYPDKFCPTLVIYNNGDTIGNIKGLYPFGGKNGISSDIIEWELSELGILKTNLEENPRKFRMRRAGMGGVNKNKRTNTYKNDKNNYNTYDKSNNLDDLDDDDDDFNNNGNKSDDYNEDDDDSLDID